MRMSYPAFRESEGCLPTLEDPTSVLDECRQALEIHHRNYDSDGPNPSQLQLLRWEFHKEHYRIIRVYERGSTGMWEPIDRPVYPYPSRWSEN